MRIPGSKFHPKACDIVMSAALWKLAWSILQSHTCVYQNITKKKKKKKKKKNILYCVSQANPFQPKTQQEQGKMPKGIERPKRKVPDTPCPNLAEFKSSKVTKPKPPPTHGRMDPPTATRSQPLKLPKRDDLPLGQKRSGQLLRFLRLANRSSLRWAPRFSRNIYVLISTDDHGSLSLSLAVHRCASTRHGLSICLLNLFGVFSGLPKRTTTLQRPSQSIPLSGHAKGHSDVTKSTMSYLYKEWTQNHLTSWYRHCTYT